MATKRAPRHYRIEDREAFEREETEEESLDLPKETSAEVQGSLAAPEGGFNAATRIRGFSMPAALQFLSASRIMSRIFSFVR